jgi:tetrahydromethanopterin S-methyltransferase subunit G
MSEKHIQSGGEHLNHLEHDPKRAAEQLREVEERARQSEHDPLRHAENLRHTIKEEAISSQEYQARDTEQPSDNEPSVFFETAKIKAETFTHTMRRVRKSLTPSERRVSKFIHKPVVERTSELAAKTVARPFGILGGSVIGLVAMVITLMAAKRVGTEIPYTIFPLFFAGGYLITVGLELFIRLFKRRKHRYSD